MANAAAFARSVDVFISKHLTSQERSRVLAQFAKKDVAELIRQGRAAPSFERYVDGRLDAPEEAVRPEGAIVYQFNQLGMIIVFALSFLRARSPVLTGRYRESFYVGVNGRFIKAEMFRPELVPPDAEIVIGNTQPYSRKIDVQFVGNRKLRFSVPPGLFEEAVQAVKARFPLIQAKRVYTMKFPGQYRLVNEQYHLSGRYKGRARNRQGLLVESPAMIINPKG